MWHAVESIDQNLYKALLPTFIKAKKGSHRSLKTVLRHLQTKIQRLR